VSTKLIHNVRLRKAPYDNWQNMNYDLYLKEFVRQVKNDVLKDRNDDYLLIITGLTGTGKSNLMLWIYEEFDLEGCSINYITLNRTDFANSLDLVNKKEGLKFLAYDEANVSKRDAMTSFNKDLIDVYFSIRESNIFHVWCNPSVEMIDKPFIKERVKGLILIFDKSLHRRVYYFFKSETLIKIYEFYNNLDINNLIKSKKFAYFRGWFKPYSGKLLKDYLDKKRGRIVDKVSDFKERWGSSDLDGRISRKEMAKIIGCCYNTIINYENTLLSQGVLVEGVNVFSSASGNRSYLSETKSLFIKLRVECKEKKNSNLTQNKMDSNSLSNNTDFPE